MVTKKVSLNRKVTLCSKCFSCKRGLVVEEEELCGEENLEYSLTAAKAERVSKKMKSIAERMSR